MPDVLLLYQYDHSDKGDNNILFGENVKFFEKAGPVGCRFILPESDFDLKNLIGPMYLSVLKGTLIGLTTETSQTSFHMLLNIIS